MHGTEWDRVEKDEMEQIGWNAVELKGMELK